MSRKKHPEHVNHERWLVSYADFITLLFAFFVVLFASGQNDKRKSVMLAHSMQSAFSHNGIFDPHSRTPPLADDPNAVPNAIPSPVSLPVPSVSNPDINGVNKPMAERIREVVKTQVAERRLPEGIVTVRPAPDGLVVSLREAGFFASGSAEIQAESLEILKHIASALPNKGMRVEGHTDNVPIHTAQFATNWELSTARAATVTRLLIAQHAADPALISAAGYAEFRPVADNATEEGRAQNRRVDIVLLAGKGLTPINTDSKGDQKR
jgi:chemotaxis protein MotB